MLCVVTHSSTHLQVKLEIVVGHALEHTHHDGPQPRPVAEVVQQQRLRTDLQHIGTIKYRAAQYSVVQCSTMQYAQLQHSTG